MDDPRIQALAEVVRQVTGGKLDFAYNYAKIYAAARRYARTSAEAHARAIAPGSLWPTSEQKVQIDTAYALLFT